MKKTDTDQSAEQTSALTIVDPAAVQKLDDTASRYSNAIRTCERSYERAFLLAEAMIKLRELLTPELMAPIMSLANTRLGFLTDRNPARPGRNGERVSPYPLEVVRDCTIEAMMQGVRLVNNEFNIISAGSYITRNGFTRKLQEFPDLTDLKIVLAVPRYSADKSGVIVTCEATWKVKGQKGDLKSEIPIRTDGGSTVDNLLGKADRKFKARIYAQLTGSELGDGEVDDLPEARNVTGSAAEPAGAVFRNLENQPAATHESAPTPPPAAAEPPASPATPMGEKHAKAARAKATESVPEGAKPVEAAAPPVTVAQPTPAPARGAFRDHHQDRGALPQRGRLPPQTLPEARRRSRHFWPQDRNRHHAGDDKAARRSSSGAGQGDLRLKT